MSVIVNDKVSIDLALRLLWRESSTREGIIQSLQKRRYFVAKSTLKHDKAKVFIKRKKRNRAKARRAASKG
jgi:ribosomal protein S21